MAKTIINGYCEIKNHEFIRFGKTLDVFTGTSANPTGDIVKCKITIEYELPEAQKKLTR